MVAVAAPRARPVSTRPTNRAGSEVDVAKISAATRPVSRAGMSTVRRPYQSDTWPTSSRLVTIPAANTAYTTVMVIDDRWSCRL